MKFLTVTADEVILDALSELIDLGLLALALLFLFTKCYLAFEGAQEISFL